MKQIDLLWILWLFFVVIWNFGWPEAYPITDVIIAVILSIILLLLIKIMKKILIILTILFCLQSYSQTKPKLVVGIVVDQMRFDYIYRFWEDFGDGGFKKLIGEGHFFRNCQFGYLPTYTGPGHASIFTGTTLDLRIVMILRFHNFLGRENPLIDKQIEKSMFEILSNNFYIVRYFYPNGCTGTPC